MSELERLEDETSNATTAVEPAPEVNTAPADAATPAPTADATGAPGTPDGTKPAGNNAGGSAGGNAGPALNPLIKVMNLVSLLILPAIINLEDNDAARLSVAGGALLVLIVAIWFSSRQPTSITGAARQPETVAVSA